MARQSSTKGQTLGHRDITQARLALAFLGSKSLDAKTIYRNYYEPTVTESSFHKTFKRDCEALEREGIHLIATANGTAKLWRLDRARTSSASFDQDMDDDARVYATLCRSLLDDPETADRRDLGFAIARLALGTGGGSGTTGPRPNLASDYPCLLDFARGLHERKPIMIKYKSLGDGRAVTRTLEVYGMFTLEDRVYAVALRRKEGAEPSIRTFFLGRVEEAQVLDDEPCYAIPRDFSVENYRKLPFQIPKPGCEEEPYAATFYFQRYVRSKLPASAESNGTVTRRQGGSAEFTCRDVCNTDEAARWCIANGAIPLSPQTLVDNWEEKLKEVSR